MMNMSPLIDDEHVPVPGVVNGDINQSQISAIAIQSNIVTNMAPTVLASWNSRFVMLNVVVCSFVVHDQYNVYDD